jgi:PAS domain S-box-containing protein
MAPASPHNLPEGRVLGARDDNGVSLPSTSLVRAAGRDHDVRFYGSDEELAAILADFIVAGLNAGEPVVVLTTREHERDVRERSRCDRALMADAAARGQLRFLDARAILAEIMRGEHPDRTRFFEVVGGLLDDVRAAHPGTTVRAHGELVDLLCQVDNPRAAVELEGLWAELQQQRPFSLACSYVLAGARAARTLASGFVAPDLAMATGGEPREPPAIAATSFSEALASEIARGKRIEGELLAALGEAREREAALAESQRQLCAITDALPMPVSYVDDQGRYRFANQAHERWFGIAREAIIGRSVSEVLGPQACAEIEEAVARALAGRRVTIQRQLPHRHGGERFVDITYVPHASAGGAVHGFVALISDISESKRIEVAREAASQRAARLMRVTAAIAEAVEPEQVLQAVVDRVAEAIGASSVELWLLSENGERLRSRRAVGYDPASGRVLEAMLSEAPKLPAADAVRQNAPIWLSSRPELERTYPELAMRLDAEVGRSLACLPLGNRGTPRGAIAITFGDERTDDPAERDFLLLVARYAGQAIERLQSLEMERTLRTHSEAAGARLALSSRASSALAAASPQLERLLRAVVDQIAVDFADGSCIALIDGGRLEVPAVAYRDVAAASELRASMLADPPRLGTSVLSQVMLAGTPLWIADVDPEFMRRSVSPSRHAWLERHMPRSLLIVPLRIGGVVIGSLSAVREDCSPPFSLDDQKLLEEIGNRTAVAIAAGRLYEANQQARARAELLYELAAAVIRAQSVDEVFDAALEGIERALDSNRCSILTFDDEGVMRFRAWRGLSAGYRAAVEGHSPWARDADDPQPIVIPDVLAEPSLAPYAELFRSERIGALGFIPLVSEGKLIGKFMVYYRPPRQLSASELDMAKAIANHLAAAIGRFSALRELTQTVRFNEIFTGMLGHDLRNPLGAIMAAAQIAVRRSGSGGAIDKPLARILQSGERMATMIDQLLDFTRVRVGAGIPIDPKPADVCAVMRQAVDELSDTHPGWRFSFERDAGDMSGMWDSDRILQVFSNLAANAVQHGLSDHGVTVRFEGAEPDAVCVKIHNMGAVPEDLLPHLFEPMAGGDRRLHRSRGLGLGLYISREIVKAHGGELRVETSLEQGTTFSVRLPRVARSGSFGGAGGAGAAEVRGE